MRFILLAACQLHLASPVGAVITCTDTCPRPLVCQQGQCVDAGVTIDAAAPALQSAAAVGVQAIVLQFDEIVVSSGLCGVDGLEVQAQTTDARQITLVTSAQWPGDSYTVTCADVTDGSGNQGMAPSTPTLVAIDGAYTYYWRVDTSQPRRIVAFDDTVYVHCEAECVEGSTLAGNQSEPRRTIQGGIQTAVALGLTRVQVTARPGNVAYEGAMTLANGVSVIGDINVKVRVHATGRAVVFATGITLPTELAGFELSNGPSDDVSMGLSADSCTDAFTVRDNTIEAGDAVNASIGVALASAQSLPHPVAGSGPLLLRNIIRAGLAITASEAA